MNENFMWDLDCETKMFFHLFHIAELKSRNEERGFLVVSRSKDDVAMTISPTVVERAEK